MTRAVWQNVIKMCSGITFYVAIVIAYILLICAYVHIDQDTGKAFNIITLIMSSDRRNIIMQADINAETIFLGENSGYIWMFAPIVTALPYVAYICTRVTNTNVRFELYRVGKKSYIIGKIVSALLVGGIIMSVSYVFYGMTLFLVTGQKLRITPIYLRRILSAWLYGAVSLVPVTALSSVIRNKYLSLSMPFMLNYIYEMMFNSIIASLNVSKNLMFQLDRILRPSKVQVITQYPFKDRIVILSLYIILYIGIMIIHHFILNRRCDCGE